MNFDSISNHDFWGTIRENDGLLAITARAITRRFGVACSYRQVKERAEADPVKLAEIRENLLDMAEKNLLKLMKSPDESVCLQATAFYLATKGAKPETPTSHVPDEKIREIVTQVITELHNKTQ